MHGTWEAGEQLPLFDGEEAVEAKQEADDLAVGAFSAALHLLLDGHAVRREIWGGAAGLI